MRGWFIAKYHRPFTEGDKPYEYFFEGGWTPNRLRMVIIPDERMARATLGILAIMKHDYGQSWFCRVEENKVENSDETDVRTQGRGALGRALRSDD